VPEIKFVQPEGLNTPATYTHVVTARSGTTVFISGQVALDADGQVVGRGDLRAQARQAHENLKIALAAVGASFANVVKMTTFVVEFKPGDRELLAAVRDEYLPRANRPASTLVGVSALAIPEYLIEIEAIAVV
jgi:enamine deaminase RidA (YjgF/YER057c/UK114 family)